MIPFSHLGKCKSFGELALSIENKAALRMASVICLTDCIFATLAKSDYTEIIALAD